MLQSFGCHRVAYPMHWGLRMRKRPPVPPAQLEHGPVRIRSSHGAAAARGQAIVVEVLPKDGQGHHLRPAPPALAAPIERDTLGRFTPEGAMAAARRRADLAKLPDFLTRELEFAPAESFAPFDAARRDLLAVRISELVERYGTVSPGVVTVLRGWSWVFAFAEHAAMVAARDSDTKAEERACKYFRAASLELAKAHELARVEGVAKPQPTPADLLWQQHLRERAAQGETD